MRFKSRGAAARHRGLTPLEHWQQRWNTFFGAQLCPKKTRLLDITPHRYATRHAQHSHTIRARALVDAALNTARSSAVHCQALGAGRWTLPRCCVHATQTRRGATTGLARAAVGVAAAQHTCSIAIAVSSRSSSRPWASRWPPGHSPHIGYARTLRIRLAPVAARLSHHRDQAREFWTSASFDVELDVMYSRMLWYVLLVLTCSDMTEATLHTRPRGCRDREDGAVHVRPGARTGTNTRRNFPPVRGRPLVARRGPPAPRRWSRRPLSELGK
jgi:hypothetical protein